MTTDSGWFHLQNLRVHSPASMIQPNPYKRIHRCTSFTEQAQLSFDLGLPDALRRITSLLIAARDPQIAASRSLFSARAPVPVKRLTKNVLFRRPSSRHLVVMGLAPPVPYPLAASFFSAPACALAAAAGHVGRGGRYEHNKLVPLCPFIHSFLRDAPTFSRKTAPTGLLGDKQKSRPGGYILGNGISCCRP